MGVENVEDTDLLIVGAGPVGLYAAYYAGFRGMSVTVVDALEQPGGQMAALYPEKQVYDVAGFPAVKAQDLVDNLVQQAAQAKPCYLLGHTAQTLTDTLDGVTVTTHRGTVVTAKAVLITGGIGSFTPRPLPAGTAYENRGLHYFVPKPAELTDADVVIVGGGDSAVDWALALEPLARSVALVHRRPQFRAHEHSVRLLRESSVRLCTPHEVERITGENHVEEVELRDLGTGGTEHLKADAVVAALGFVANLGPLTQWGLTMRGRHIEVDRTMRTNHPRIFAAGDIADYDGKVALISVGLGEAALAVNHIAPVIDPAQATVPGHSSDSP
ncbi:NAD(P)/FAD-dependent oxidoreductase [Streptomyces sp. NPDC047081]|uniref:NAD(P)/FAD-dependent oxidoreductase n=1 Tax=Streptomyces sp. NPDC047081 TaxID=3154706 RepID=UPI0033C339E6